MAQAAREALAEPRFERLADGVIALVIERPSVLPPTLDALLATIAVVERLAIRVSGFAKACADVDHRLVPWVKGHLAGRDLRLAMCADCGVVEVRDVSVDRLPGLGAGVRLAPRRRDDLIGWYTGPRPANRIYF